MKLLQIFVLYVYMQRLCVKCISIPTDLGHDDRLPLIVKCSFSLIVVNFAASAAADKPHFIRTHWHVR